MITSAPVAVAIGFGATGVSASQETAGSRNVYDSFQRTTHNGWGAAQTGGAWTTTGSGVAFSVSPGSGKLTHVPAGKGASAILRGVSAKNEDVTTTFSMPILPTAGSGVYFSTRVRVQSNGSAYAGKIRVWPSGRLSLSVSRLTKSTETVLANGGTSLKAKPGVPITLETSLSGQSVHVRAYAAGAKPGSTWQVSATDTSSRSITAAGAIGIYAYISRSTPAVGLWLNNISGNALGSSTPASPSKTTTTPASPSKTSSSPTSAPPKTSTAPPSQTSSPIPPPRSTTSSTGSAPIGSTDYPVPGNALFVSPGGSDSGGGTISSPFRTITKAVTAAKSGQTIVLRTGNYNESVTIPSSKSLTIQPYPHEAAWFDGSTTVAGWTKTADGWAHAGWTPQFDDTAGFTPAIAANTTPGWNWVNPQYPLASHPDQAWLDGSALTQVGSASALKADTFYVDYSSKTLYVGSDPTGHSVTASNIPDRALVVYGPNSTIRGVGFRNYGTSIPQMATVILDGANDNVSNVVIQDNANIGMYLRSTNLRVDQVTVQDNGLLGILGTYADGSTVSRTQATQNNTQRFNYAPVAGGIKISRTRGFTIKDSDVTGNIGHGLWMDESCYDMTIVGNTLSDNLGAGFRSELSDRGVIANNVVANNGAQGIFLEDTGDIQIWNNTFSSSSPALELFQDTRKNVASTPGHDPRQANPDPTVPWITKNIQVSNNLFLAGAQYDVVAADQTAARTANQMALTVNGNHFLRPSQSGWVEFGWGINGTKLAGYNSPSAFTSATGQGQQNTDQAASTSGTLMAQVRPSDIATTHPLALPAAVASVIGVDTGTAYTGAFSE